MVALRSPKPSVGFESSSICHKKFESKGDTMVLIGKKEFQLAKNNGFECIEHYTRSASGKKYSISDDDYLRMKKFIRNMFKITEYK